ncbi:hypothetical protein [Streptomyces sp. NPDC048650]|uniref:hypothetical protein n=1 Tax=unclassified Streptomyces TaxID=2593676 RepID=UPI003722272A
MTEYEDNATRTEQLRAGFQQQGSPGLAEEASREARQTRRVYFVAATVVTLLGVGLLIYRFVHGDPVGTWIAFYAASIAVSALGVVLARSGRPRLAFAATLIGAASLGIGDTLIQMP